MHNPAVLLSRQRLPHSLFCAATPANRLSARLSIPPVSQPASHTCATWTLAHARTRQTDRQAGRQTDGPVCVCVLASSHRTRMAAHLAAIREMFDSLRGKCMMWCCCCCCRTIGFTTAHKQTQQSLLAIISRSIWPPPPPQKIGTPPSLTRRQRQRQKCAVV